MISYVGIGSNQADPIKQTRLAIDTLQGLPQSVVIQCSSLYCSTPMGPQDQPDYINAVIEIDTQLTALQLLDELQKVELLQGRVRKENRWGPRTLDLDIILYGNESINNTRLTIPHYGMKVREFVIYPLLEISVLLLTSTTASRRWPTVCSK